VAIAEEIKEMIENAGYPCRQKHRDIS
jgi:hypothetical protein